MLDFFRSTPDWLVQDAEYIREICEEVFLVGGAIRGLLRGSEVDDFDFVVKKNAIQAARLIADKTGGDIYVLDKKRHTARAIVMDGDKPIKLDFALLNGNSIEEDLSARDFTINAIAVRFPYEGELIDPTFGKQDLDSGILRPCSTTSFIDDPVRTIRYMRFLYEMGLQSAPGAEEKVKQAVPDLIRVSPERQRDALMDVINVANAPAAFAKMLDLGIISQIFPGAEKLTEVELSPPHTYNAWDHTIQVVNYTQQFMSCFTLAPEITQIHPRLKEALDYLIKYQDKLRLFFAKEFADGRNKYQILILSAFFHDLAKGTIDHEFKGERKKFPGHAKRGAQLVKDWSKKHNLSNGEMTYLYNIVRTHMKVSRPEIIDPNTKNVSLFRFFNLAGEAGVLTAILHLADVLTTYEDKLTDKRWQEALTAVEGIFDAFFFHYDELIDPTPLLNGKEIMDLMKIQQGKKVGELLSLLQEAQVSGKVRVSQQAKTYLKELSLKETGENA